MKGNEVSGKEAKEKSVVNERDVKRVEGKPMKG